MIKIVKFGGSSVASATQFQKVKGIVQADESRRFVVVSASGKANKDDNKITDLLYLCHAHLKYNISPEPIFNMIEQRFLEIKKELQLQYDIQKDLDALRKELVKTIDVDYLVSRGEYLTGLLMAEYLDYHFVDAKDIVFFNYDGSIDYPKIKQAFEELVVEYPKLVIPGFYGSLPDGTIRIMSRGGGDVSGSIMANVVDADVYENWTDVSGILKADPRIVKNPKQIEIITYAELRELSYMGASVLHEEAIFPVKHKNIPIHILNTNDPESKGTIIVNQVDDSKDTTSTITGIAGKKDFSIITIKKSHMSTEVGTIRRALDVIDKYGLSVEHLPTGIDSFSIVLESAPLKPILYDVLVQIKEKCKTSDIHVMDNVALIATVSRFMKSKTGMSGRLFTTLGKKGINISMISQTSDEMNIIVGVHNDDYGRTIDAIYEEFEGE
ncbi:MULTISPECIES: aspartate kinase [Breznakia]|uniref:Aspartokinase n=1 Tax=Breznakia blatticola TaxID=1754012 RepID=A0A4R7ZHD7_9FIRM|nr:MULTISPECIES: aspartate kinase [Breznakia]MDH6367097.1 aspartate kinase [Breznakia sp. PH1-1]MDH6404316.1 aspartate kinase [Breznakia sp. PF1-11]MDH6411984.1 aspartate kinase [Breznakia sp. PFB1-11]MDH6414304.1 aspartate kinase [Breznakia sp. PFB1-14]MDH6416598.1 aspartate kinase [Breznakia sp. PFB1-4]